MDEPPAETMRPAALCDVEPVVRLMARHHDWDGFAFDPAAGLALKGLIGNTRLGWLRLVKRRRASDRHSEP